MNLLSQYIVASTHLYGAVPKKFIADIYNDQNDKQITLDDVETSFHENQQEIEKAFVYLKEDYFTHESVLIFEDLEAMLQQQAGKPRYVPEKEELLRYLDDFYFEQNRAYTSLYHYVLENIVDGDSNRATAVCEDVQGMIEVNSSFNQLMKVFDRMRVEFKSRKQKDTVKQMVKVLQKNVRLWKHNGHTTKELQEQGYNLSTSTEQSKESTTIKKLGRNDPCHCGSGKKYKKCCMDKDQKLKAQ